MNLVILTEQDRVGKGRFVLADHRAVHIRTVLRITPGETVEVGLVDGPLGTALCESSSEHELVLTCDHWREAPVPTPTIDIVCAIPRPKTLRKLLIFSAIMGVRRILFVRANRTDKSYLQSPWLQPEQHRPFLLEGLSQGRQTRLPEVHTHQLFRPFVEDTLPDLENREPVPSVKLLSDPYAAQVVGELGPLSTGPRYLLAIGPEGGWVPFEMELFAAAGFRPVGLGPWTLRVEMALVAAIAQVSLVDRMRNRHE
jgi:RsmE family RNA methyltransferase